MLIKKLYDTLFPFNGITENRIVTRAFIFNSNNEVLLHYLVTDDEFGHRECVETPGGGKKKFESLIHSVKREIKEETGYDVKVLKLVSVISDYYNLIKRHNINFYFVCVLRSNDKSDLRLDDYEKDIIKSTKFYNINEATYLYNNVNSTNKVGILVKNRELDSLKLAYDYIKNRK